jgi:hypothetical protein
MNEEEKKYTSTQEYHIGFDIGYNKAKKEMGNRMIQILNRLIRKFEDWTHGKSNLEYCISVKKKLEEELKQEGEEDD